MSLWPVKLLLHPNLKADSSQSYQWLHKKHPHSAFICPAFRVLLPIESLPELLPAHHTFVAPDLSARVPASACAKPAVCALAGQGWERLADSGAVCETPAPACHSDKMLHLQLSCLDTML